MNDMVANNLALVQSESCPYECLYGCGQRICCRDLKGSLESIDALSANWSSLKSELAAVSGLTLTAYPGSTKETEAAELLQNLPTGIFRLRAQPPVSVLSGNKLGANYRRRAVLVPGQLLSASFPNLIVLNSESGEAGWETTSQEWIPEDEAYNRLVLRF